MSERANPAPAAPAVVEREAWLAALDSHRAAEKDLTRAHDRLAAERRRLPRERIERDYRFGTPAGPAGLADLFDGRRQLIVYHHMLKPADPAPCPGCSMVGDQMPHLAHLHARDTLYRTYFTTGRGVETLGTTWTLLDLMPFGRQENWEASPEGTPQTAPYQWWRLHDEY